MAEIFDKPITSGFDRTLVLDPQEAFIYPFPFSDWNTIRVGMYFSFTTVDDPNACIPDGTTFRINYSSASEQIFFGLKYNDPHLPLTENEPFCGVTSNHGVATIRQGAATDYSAGGFSIGEDWMGAWSGPIAGSNEPMVIYPNKVKEIFPTAAYPVKSYAWNFGQASKFAETSGYCSYLSFWYRMTNKGTSGQSISFSYDRVNELSDTSPESLKFRMLNGLYENPSTKLWTHSSIPMDLPNALIAYIPAHNVRMRIHSVGIIKDS